MKLSRGCLLLSACLLFAACVRGEQLPCGAQESCPDGLVCSEGLCVQEPSCDGGNCPIPITRCPATVPKDASLVFAAVDLRCTYEVVCCCGECKPTTTCSAEAGESFTCLVEDRCFIDPCKSP